MQEARDADDVQGQPGELDVEILEDRLEALHHHRHGGEIGGDGDRRHCWSEVEWAPSLPDGAHGLPQPPSLPRVSMILIRGMNSAMTMKPTATPMKMISAGS